MQHLGQTLYLHLRMISALSAINKRIMLKFEHLSKDFAITVNCNEADSGQAVGDNRNSSSAVRRCRMSLLRLR